jgi:tryptophan synthase alpha chain
VLINLRGRGDKDMGTAIEWFGLGDPTDRGAVGDPEASHERRTALREGARRGPRRAGRLPARRLPRRRRRHRGAAAMVDAGCDVIEVGLPYSDPVMDGPTIQAAAQQALDGGVRTRDVLRTVEAVAATGVPTVVMTYWNPVERYGVERFAADLADAGGAGLITPDLTPDAAASGSPPPTSTTSTRSSWSRPSSTDERIAMTTAACRGFVYATAVMGVTGARTTSRPRRPAGRAHPAPRRTDLPVGVGSGVSQRRPGRRGGVVRRRRHRRLRVRAHPARPARRPAAGLRALSASPDLAGGVRRA